MFDIEEKEPKRSRESLV